MAESPTAPTRLPRGTKPVAQAFFTALATVPDAQRFAVARAAQILIRDGMRMQRQKARASALSAAAPSPVKRAAAAGPKTAAKRRRATVAKPLRQVTRRRPRAARV